jgi:hypothetical protein
MGPKITCTTSKNIIWLKKTQDNIFKKIKLRWKHIESTWVNLSNIQP